ncbi:MAG: hypothetical protein ACOYT8_02090 [Candidatus Dependentiae bacterium]
MSKNRLIYIVLVLFAANNCQFLHSTDIKEWLYEHRYAVVGTACATTVLVCSYVRMSKLKQKQMQSIQEPEAKAVTQPKPVTDENKILLLLPSDTITLDVIAEKQKLLKEKMQIPKD